MSETAKVMLAMSFFKNYEEARETARRFCSALGGHNRIVLGIETEANRDENLPDAQRPMSDFLDEIKQDKWPEVFLWDKNCDKVLDSWAEHLPLPFYHKYSYGGAVNRLLSLAKTANCDYLVRVDPGTAPIDNFANLVSSHIEKIAKGEARVVSGQYTKRIALRNDFVPDGQRAEYYQFILKYTGVDSRPGKQVTGGAAFTISVMGPPAIPFNGAMVWASDDGYFQFVFPDSALVIAGNRVDRGEPGYGMAPLVYFVRLANMVILHGLHSGFDKLQARYHAHEFLEKLSNFLDENHQKTYEFNSARDSLDKSVDAVVDGYENYKLLKDAWQDVIEVLNDRIKNLNRKHSVRIK